VIRRLQKCVKFICSAKRIIGYWARSFKRTLKGFKRALAWFDEENSDDPNREIVNGMEQPKRTGGTRNGSPIGVLRLRPGCFGRVTSCRAMPASAPMGSAAVVLTP